MTSPIDVGIHLFRRDYRLDDNTALLKACGMCKTVIPVFVFTYDQIRDNPLKSNNCVQFLCESLVDLNKQLLNKHSKLFIFYGDLEDIIKKLMRITNATTLFTNMEYTKYGKLVERKLSAIEGLKTIIVEDITLNPITSVRTTGNLIYTKFTPYYRKASSSAFVIAKPVINKYGNFWNSVKSMSTLKLVNVKDLAQFHDSIINEHIVHRGGRTEAQKVLRRLEEFKDYDDKRNELDYKTTRLSAYNKFGCVSIREVYWSIANSLGKHNQLITQLYWRDFFYTLSYYHDEIYSGPLNPKWRDLEWSHDESLFKAWKEGKTGFPIVDAAMRELNTTGYMHNRGRLIVSSFLTRLLGIDWRKGEHYFAQTLYDYDPAQNNLGWQVSGGAVSGTESRPIEQTILNPWIQSAKFDPDGNYIKQWIPELKDVDGRLFHKWDEVAEQYKEIYMKPIIDYKTAKINNLKMYKKYISK
jgi:deoxyribodipyrimidine photo-lyase